MTARGNLSDEKEALEYRITTGRIAPEIVNKCASIKNCLFSSFHNLLKKQNCLKTNTSLDF